MKKRVKKCKKGLKMKKRVEKRIKKCKKRLENEKKGLISLKRVKKGLKNDPYDENRKYLPQRFFYGINLLVCF